MSRSRSSDGCGSSQLCNRPAVHYEVMSMMVKTRTVALKTFQFVCLCAVGESLALPVECGRTFARHSAVAGVLQQATRLLRNHPRPNHTPCG